MGFNQKYKEMRSKVVEILDNEYLYIQYKPYNKDLPNFGEYVEHGKEEDTIEFMEMLKSDVKTENFAHLKEILVSESKTEFFDTLYAEGYAILYDLYEKESKRIKKEKRKEKRK